MKKLAVLLLALCGDPYAQAPAASSINGGNLYVNQPLTFAGNSTLSLTHNKDTLSDPVVLTVNATRPIQYMVLEYKAIAADSDNSGYQIDVWTRTCTNPIQSTGCPAKWVKPRFRTIYDRQHFADTMIVDLVRQDTNWFSHTFFIPSGNQAAFRFYKAGNTTQNIQKISLTGN